MGRIAKRLSALEVNRLMKSPGKHPVGDNIYLQVTSSLTSSWIFRYRGQGKDRWMGMGPTRDFSLADVRQRALDLRRARFDGVDPLVKKEQEASARAAAEAMRITFEMAADQFISSQAPGWKCKKQEPQWRASLKNYAFPVIGKLAVSEIERAHVLKILEPIWTTKTETADRVRRRTEKILSWAKVKGYRNGENPAAWKQNLELILPKPGDVMNRANFASLHYSKLNTFISELRKRGGVSASALEFSILATTRPNETMNARWEEFDFDRGVWTIPEERMKAGKEHRIPITPRMKEILESMRALGTTSLVFPGQKKGRSLTENAFLNLIESMGYRGETTAHGFRATFKTWGHEMTSHPRELIEQQLAHTIQNKAEAAYMRSDLLIRRKALLGEWEGFLGREWVGHNDVIPLRA